MFAPMPKPYKCSQCGGLYDTASAIYHDPLCINKSLPEWMAKHMNKSDKCRYSQRL